MGKENTCAVEKRAFIRHPSDVPLDIRLDNPEIPVETGLNNVGAGGLAIISNTPFRINSVLSVRIPHIQPVFEVRGRVVWCKESSGRYEIGVEFIETKDAFGVRMAEQICHIERYKKEIRDKEGRALSGREAALEWIEKNASSF
jgi:hypothetical protein